MKRWGFLVAGLYALVLIVLTYPVMQLAFTNVSAHDLLPVFRQWIYWAWITVMFLCQFCLLLVPAKLTGGRPVSRRALLFPVVAAGLLIGAMVAGAILSLIELVCGKENYWAIWQGVSALSACGIAWIVWSVVFYRQTRHQNPEQVMSTQRRHLLRGSILELLIAVPTHIVARYRDYCCAGFMTFIGITFGLAVMLFAYGPAVFVLFAARWKRLQPRPNEYRRERWLFRKAGREHQ